MTTTHSLIASQTLTSTSASTITFTSIPQTFTDLKIVYSARNTGSADPWYQINVNFNSDTTTGNYPSIIVYNASNSAGSGYGFVATGYSVSDVATANTFSNGEIYISNYTSSSHKTISSDTVNERNSATNVIALYSTLWQGTAAITSIKLTQNANNFAVGSSFYLYGISSDTAIQNKSVPYASGGDTVTTDGTYWYHTFTKSDNFIPWKNLSTDVLVVAGGGGGSNFEGGGGGGGYSEQSGRSCLSNKVYPVIVGAGGPGASLYSSNGNKWLRGDTGSNSVFDTITSNGGGGGGSNSPEQDGAAGGSAGGGGPAGNGGTANQGNSGGATGYGNNGGNGSTNGTTYSGGGGGGGAGAAGGNASTTVAGNGGNGKSSSISGSSVTYAGGGGGGGNASSYTAGTGGTGGGGNGAKSTSGGYIAGTNGTANTGGGGGGGAADCPECFGYNGGSGIVIIKYAV